MGVSLGQVRRSTKAKQISRWDATPIRRSFRTWALSTVHRLPGLTSDALSPQNESGATFLV